MAPRSLGGAGKSRDRAWVAVKKRYRKVGEYWLAPERGLSSFGKETLISGGVTRPAEAAAHLSLVKAWGNMVDKQGNEPERFEWTDSGRTR
jgi:hypothetical protein